MSSINTPAPPTGAPTSSTSSSGDPTTATSVSAFGPDDNIFTLQYINDNGWPADFELDIDLGNWPLWLRHVSLLAARQGFSEWLDGSLSCPDNLPHQRSQ